MSNGQFSSCILITERHMLPDSGLTMATSPKLKYSGRSQRDICC